METIEFTTRSIDEMESANYFGGENDETDEQIELCRRAWETRMREFGFEIGGTYDRELFDSRAQDALISAVESTF